jgi:hypothetical protein
MRSEGVPEFDKGEPKNVIVEAALYDGEFKLLGAKDGDYSLIPAGGGVYRITLYPHYPVALSYGDATLTLDDGEETVKFTVRVFDSRSPSDADKREYFDYTYPSDVKFTFENYDEKYLSPDKQVYAGTCLFPETTWFSRNLGHSQLHEIDPIVTEFFRTNGALTAVGEGSLEKFPQFFNYVDGKFEVILIRRPATIAELNDIIISLVRQSFDAVCIQSFKTSYMKVKSREEVNWTLDGEFGGTYTDVEIKNVQEAFPIMVRK